MQRLFAFLVTLTLVAIYILSPIDLLPEAVLGPIGVIDDGAAIALVVKSFYDMLNQESWNSPSVQYACAATFIAALVVPAAFCYFTLQLFS